VGVGEDGGEDGSDGGAGGDDGRGGVAGVAGVGSAGGGVGGDGVTSKDVVGGLGSAGEPGVSIDGGEGGDVVVRLVDGEGVQERGDSCNSPSSPSHRSNSTSQRRFTALHVRLAGGGEAGGDVSVVGGGGGGGAVKGGCAGVIGEFLEALVPGKPADSSALEPVAAALRRGRRRRGFRAAGSMKAEMGGDREAVRETSWRPAA
jgi:hypothetical protein